MRLSLGWNSPLPAALFGSVLGLSGLGQAWRVAVRLWDVPAGIGEGVLAGATGTWALLLLRYLWQAWRHPQRLRQEFLHPVQGSTPALLAVSTLLVVLAVRPYSHTLAGVLAVVGIGWHLGFSLWHTGLLWQGGRAALDTLPSLYLPSVAGNFTSAAALGALGAASWGWLFMGVGIFSWMALESLVVQRLWHPQPVPVPQRPLLGIQPAPPVVCAMAWLILAPQEAASHGMLLLWGYGLYQLLLTLRLAPWLRAQRFAPSYWAYTFGLAAATVCTLKLAVAGVGPAQALAVPVFLGANLFIGYLALRSLFDFVHRLGKPGAPG